MPQEGHDCLEILRVFQRFAEKSPLGTDAGVDQNFYRKVADVWKKDVWEFQAKSGSSGSCHLFLHFLGKIAVRKMSGRTPGSPRHPSSRHPRPSDSREIWESLVHMSFRGNPY